MVRVKTHGNSYSSYNVSNVISGGGGVVRSGGPTIQDFGIVNSRAESRNAASLFNEPELIKETRDADADLALI
jgi:hypothetical protein